MTCEGGPLPIGTQHEETHYPTPEEQLHKYVVDLLIQRQDEIQRELAKRSSGDTDPLQGECATIEFLFGFYEIRIERSAGER